MSKSSICMVDALSLVLECSARAMCIVGSVEIASFQCETCFCFCLGFWHGRL